jgi:hypothetical protein
MDRRDCGMPSSAGREHARDLTSTMTCGGESGRPAASGLVFQTSQALLVEALSPPGYDLAGSVQALSDLLVRETFGSEEDDLGAKHLKVR